MVTNHTEFLRAEPEKIDLKELRERNKLVKTSEFASIYDIGNGIICLELHTKSSALNSEVVVFMGEAQEELNKNWDGMVIAGTGRHFCVGADLTVVAQVISEKDWKKMDQLLARTHVVYRAAKYSAKPIAAAIHGMVLGGGCEMILQSPAVQAAEQSYVGLVEMGVGLIPAGGGVKEAILKGYNKVQNGGVDPAEAIWPYLDNMAMKRVSTDAHNAKQIDYLRSIDGISKNPDYLLWDAKQKVLKMISDSYTPPIERPIPSFGTIALQPLKQQCAQLLEAGYIGEYDLYIAERVVDLMAGGSLPAGSMLSEEYIEQAERDLFCSLCGNPKTQDRITHMLKTGKQLRN